MVDYLTTIKTWLDSNPSQVITLLLTNGDGVDISDFGTVMSDSGLSSYAYAPGSTLSMDEWPTLQELIDAGTRLVMFIGKQATQDLQAQTLTQRPRLWRGHICRTLHS